MNDQSIEELASKIIESFAEEGRWTFSDATLSKCFTDKKSGISFLFSVEGEGTDSWQVFRLIHGGIGGVAKRCLLLPANAGNRIWAEASKITPEAVSEAANRQWFVDQLEGKN